jgi:phenylpropionate dioxygenase-like ring-hydroxylating dioxygenase large terminal subunit
MIPNQWYPICFGGEVRGRPLALRRMGQDLVAWRDGRGTVVVMNDRCPHRGAARSQGHVRDGQLECPWHGFRFDESGACRHIPAEGADAKIPSGLSTPPYSVKEGHGLVWLFWHPDAPNVSPSVQLPPLPWFESFDSDDRTIARSAIDWPVNHVRSIEANFDVHHFPFVHRSVFPGMGKRVDPYEVNVDGTRICTRGEIRREGSSKGFSFEIDFEAPSIMRLAFGGFSFVVADCPIDDYATRRLVIYQQRWIRVPGIGRLLSWVFMMLDWKWVQNRQDLKIAATQTPQLPDLAIEHLIGADGGTAAYRKLRHRLLREAGVASASEITPRPEA